MKKSVFISIILFLCSTILQMLLNFIVNEQLISRILYGVDYHTYFMNYYSRQGGLVSLISGDKMPYSWIFSISNIIIALLCVIIIFVIIKKLKPKYTITKKEFVMIMTIFSMLSLWNVIFASCLSSLTVGGKAIGKKIAIKNSTNIIYNVGKMLSIFKK